MTIRQLSNGLILCVALVVEAPSAWADILVLSTGERRSGIVEDIPGQPDSVMLTDAGGKVTINRNRISQIIREPKALSLCTIGDQLFERGLHDEALGYYQRAEQADPNTPKIQERVQAAKVELDRRANEQRKQRVLEIAENLRAARECMDSRKFDEAQEHLTRAELLGPDSAQAEELRNIRIQMLMAWGQDRLDKMDKPGAAEKFEAVLQLAPQHPQATEELIKIWQDDGSKADQLQALLKAKLKDDPNDLVTLKRLAELDYRQRHYEEALPLYLKLHDSAGQKGTEVQARLKTMLETMRDDAASKGNLEKAIQLHKQFMELFPAEANPSLLDGYDFRLRKSRIAPNDAEGWLELAAWAQERDMDAQALELYDQVLNIDPKNDKAQRAYDAYALQRILEAKDVYTKGEYALARSLFDQVVKEFPKSPTAVAEAIEWSQRCDIQIQKEKRLNEEAGQGLLESANNYYERAQSAVRMLTESPFQVREAPAVSNPRREAIKYFRLAITAFQEASRLAPSLPQVVSGEVRIKLKESQDMLQRLANPIDFGLPRVNFRAGP